MKKLFTAIVIILSIVLLASCGAKKPVKPSTNPTAKPHTLVEGNWVNYKNFKSAFLKFPHNIIIYLPKNYSNSTASYPVLYAHDGQNLFDAATGFAGEWKLDENIEALQKEGLLGDLIVVGVYNNAMRMSEYTPTKISNQWVNNDGGQLSNYAKFLVEELKPFIDSNFRTLKDRANTGVMGSSLGGIASFYILGLYPETFGKAACISPSFWWDDNRVMKDLKFLKFPKDCKIYLDGGWKEGDDESTMVPYMRGVYVSLKARGLADYKNLLYYEDPEGSHNEFNWAKRGKWPIIFLYGKFVPTVSNIKPVITPPSLKKGSVARVYTEIVYANGTKSTVFGQGLKFDNPKVAKLISNNTLLLGVSAGSGTLTAEVGGLTVQTQLTVLP